MSDLQKNYRQITAQRQITKDNFARGVIDFSWSIGRPFGMLWNKSYFRVGLKITGNKDTRAPKGVAFADNAPASLFTNCYARVGGMDISSIVNFLPQAHQVKTRLDKSGSWLNSIGKSAFGMDPDWESRLAKTERKDIALGTNPEYTIAIAAAAPGGTTTTVTGANTLLNTDDSKLVEGDVLLFPGGQEFVVASDATDDIGAGCTVTVPAGFAGIVATKGVVKVGHGTNTVYMNFQPPIGIFDHAHVMGSGDYRIQLNPNAYYKTAIVQSIEEMKVGAYDVEVTDLQFFLCTVNTDQSASGYDHLQLFEYQLASKKLQPNGETLLDFTVPPSTRAISVFIQHQSAGGDTRYPPTLFKTLPVGQTENLESLQISYANENKPSTRWSSQSKDETKLANGIDQLQQRYLDTQMYSGRIFSEGGSETYEDWKKRGQLNHFSWLRDTTDKSTHVQLNLYVPGVGDEALAFIVAHYTRTITITLEDGLVVDVVSQAS